MSRRILITGGSGLLALNWALNRRDLDEIVLAMHERQVNLAGVKAVKVDTTSVEEIKKSFNAIKPDLVIHTAGLTSVEGCEKDLELAREINTELAANVASVCSGSGIPLVHISTDHIFDGDLAMATEEETPAPLNVYGITKAQAEEKVLALCPGALIVRTNFYGWGPGYRASFSDLIIKTLREGKELNLFDDVFYTPILAESLINAVHELLEKGATMIYHVVGDERISKYHFGLAIAKEFELDSTLIKRGKMAENHSLVKRPYDMSLSNKKALGLLHRSLGNIEQQLKCLHEQEKSGFINEIITL